MNYPVWDIDAPGLLIAFVAIVHVFIAHFAVGGGLLLVVSEHRARRRGDAAFLDYLVGLSRFFILVTLVLGAVTGVGIWFTIGLIHPSATSSLINIFVWGWAIEWTFFVTEIAAAIVYYYGWRKLSPKAHLAVGWVYAFTAWMSLVVINGILAFMLTPGAWLETREFWDGFFNPTYWSSLALRTAGAIGIAALFALFFASFSKDGALKARIARFVTTGFVLPAALALPLCLAWYFASAASAGIPVEEIFATESAGVGAIIAAALGGVADTGYPTAQRAMQSVAIAFPLLVLLALGLLLVRRERYGPLLTGFMLALGFVGIGAGEWAREDLRKPWVIGETMYVHSVRADVAEDVGGPPPEFADALADRHSVSAVNETGVLRAALFARVPEGWVLGEGPDPSLDPEARAACLRDAGREISVLLCAQCHTEDGFQALRPLVAGWSVGASERVLDRLEQQRGRRMPPFVGTPEEKHALAVYMAWLGGDEEAGLEAPQGAAVDIGAQLFDDQCAMCHAPESEWPIEDYLGGRGVEELAAIMPRLSELDEMMPDFEGSEAEALALARFLAGEEQAPAPPREDPLARGAQLFDDQCAMCHAPESEWPMADYLGGRGSEELAALLPRLSELNEMMFDFEGSEAERRALAEYLTSLEEDAR